MQAYCLESPFESNVPALGNATHEARYSSSLASSAVKMGDDRMRYFIFNTGGDWDSTTLFLNGEEYPATRLFIHLEAGRSDHGEPVKGGVQRGGEMEAFVLPQDPDMTEQAIFPGRIDLEFPLHKVTIENDTPTFALEMTRITLDGKDISDEITDIVINIDAVANEVEAYLTVFRPKLLGADEMATCNLL
jgi:hypothetical protein